MGGSWWKSRTFWGLVIAQIPRLALKIAEAAGDPVAISAAISEFVGVLLAGVGLRGVVLRAGGKKE